MSNYLFDMPELFYIITTEVLPPPKHCVYISVFAKENIAGHIAFSFTGDTPKELEAYLASIENMAFRGVLLKTE